ncbi:heme-binding protein [Rhodopila sp.]|uniref:heme-binding protein n=1 Tax=Rhodopila sp. TaxID=2480087 RepID=UPI003D0F8FFD
MSATNVEQAPPENRIPTVRRSPPANQVLADLGLLSDLAGTWMGTGFNLVARPDKQGNAILYLELNQTEEHLKFDPIISSIPNRGFVQDDIELFGLTYLQKISDAVTGGALHIEPGIWITQPSTTQPPVTAPPGQQIIARMGSIPHGNAILAEGVAARFTGPPTLKAGAVEYRGSIFPSFNSTPFPVGGAIFAADTSEFNLPPPPPPAPAHGFTQYTIANAASALNPRTPFGNTPAVPLPPNIDGVAIQDVVNDPIKLLQQIINKQVAEGFTFEGTVLNIASQTPIQFGTTANAPLPAAPVAVADGGGGIENIPFLTPNANSALVYATFWIEKVSHANINGSFLQLQYAQMVLLNFPILGPPPGPNFSWPHVSVATLQKVFG